MMTQEWYRIVKTLTERGESPKPVPINGQIHLELRGMVHTLEQAKWLVDDQKHSEDILATHMKMCEDIAANDSEHATLRWQARELLREGQGLAQTAYVPDIHTKYGDLAARMMVFLSAVDYKFYLAAPRHLLSKAD